MVGECSYTTLLQYSFKLIFYFTCIAPAFPHPIPFYNSTLQSEPGGCDGNAKTKALCESTGECDYIILQSKRTRHVRTGAAFICTAQGVLRLQPHGHTTAHFWL